MSTDARLDFVLPGDPETLTGGYLYDRRITEGLNAIGWRVRVHALDASFPFPTRDALRRADRAFAEIRAGSLVVIDGLALGAMPDVIARHAKRLDVVGLIHHPLGDETGLDPRERAQLADSERRAWRLPRKLIVTSAWTRQRLVERGVGEHRLGVVIPGTDRGPIARGSNSSTLKLLSVGTLTPRKGHTILIDALARLLDRCWELDCVGSLDRDRATADAVRRQIERSQLTSRIRLVGEVPADSLAARYVNSDLFVLASHLEGYGMAHAEALAHGLPMVATAAGAIPLTVPADAALLVPPGDCEALADALARVMDDAGLRGSLALGAQRARARLPSWEDASVRFDAELRALP